jgi:hypothetical protein
MASTKQLEVLRAYAAVCGDAPRGVTNPEVASIVGLKADTISVANGFFASVGLLTKDESGYVPSAEIMSYANAFQWDQERAFHKTASKFAESWFAQAILPKLRFKAISNEEAVGSIGQAIGVGPEAKREIELALWFLEQAGVIERENGTVRLGKTEESSDHEEKEAKSQAAAAAAAAEERARGTSPQGNKNRTGAIRLNVEIDVETEEIAKWAPERITAFMSGLAQVLAAKGEATKILS